MFVYNIMKLGNTSEVQGFDYDNVSQYGSVDMKGGKPKKHATRKGKSPKFDGFDFEKEWKAFEESYNQKYGGKSKKAPAKKKASSTTKKAAKKTSSTKKPKRKTQRGGDESGATFAPAQMFDDKATMSAPPSGPFQSAYGNINAINAVDGLNRNLAPFPNSSGTQTGGKKKGSKAKKTKTATKTIKPKKYSKKKDTKKDTKKDAKKETVLDKIKKFFAM